MSSKADIFSAVALPAAIMLKASAGVLTAIACQFRFSTKTVVLFRTSLIDLAFEKGFETAQHNMGRAAVFALGL
jgi:hypothetical protein